MSSRWVEVAKAADLAAGEMKGVRVGDSLLGLYNVDGTFYATSNICTHAFALLTDGWLDGDLVECPLHAGAFNVTNGAGQGSPIPCDIQTYPVRVENGAVEIGFD